MHCTYLSESLLVHHDGSLEEGEGAQGQIHLVRKLDAANRLSSSSDDPAGEVSTTGIITTIDTLCQLARREGDDTVEVVLTGPDRDAYDRFDPKVDAYLTDPLAFALPFGVSHPPDARGSTRLLHGGAGRWHSAVPR